MRDLIIDSFAGGASRPEPVTARGQRVLAILHAAHAGALLCDLRREHLDLWPRSHAGDRKWARDCRDALHGRVYGVHDATSERRVRLLNWLEDHGAATTAEVAEALGYPDKNSAWADLVAAGVLIAGRLSRADGSGGRLNMWTLAQLGARAREAA